MMSLTSIMNTKTQSKRFFSLKWKTFIVLSCVIFVVNAIFFSFHYMHLNKRYLNERNTIYSRNLTILDSVTKQHIAAIQHFTTIIPSLFGLQKALDDNDWKIAHELIYVSWPRIQAEYAIDRVVFFDREQRIVVDSETGTSTSFNDAKIGNYARSVKDSLVPESIIECVPKCFQIAFVPYLSQKSRVSVITVFSSIADLVLDFKKLTDVDIGILVPTGQVTARQPFMSEWKMSVSALTNSGLLIPFLQKVSQAQAIDSIQKNGFQGEFTDSQYEVKIPMTSPLTKESGGVVMLVENVSQQIDQMHEIMFESVLLSIAGLVIAEIVLLALLWAPMSRLKQTSLNLPLLANGDFETVRKNLTRSERIKRFAIDEVDLLNSNALNLSYQLEKLNNDVSQYTKTLAYNMSQTKRERDFVKRLLDTAQLLIVTHDANGNIVQVNHHAASLVGVGEVELIGCSFEKIFVVDRERENFSEVIKLVRQTRESHSRIESSFYSPFGNKSIAWIHSNLAETDPKNSLVLSVGLDISERKESEKRIAWLANHDPLTGLYNRRHFNELFESVLKHSARYSTNGALLFLDLDNFKYINDTQGHNAGDRLITEVATALRRITRETDIVARLGGDEFAIVIKDVDKQGIVDFCRDLNRRIIATVRPKIRGIHQTTASIGIALFPFHGKTVNELLANADIAMYQAKERGKGGWHLFSEQEQAREKLQHQINWKEKIDQALSTDNFLLYFQPILDIRENKITHYEVLLRMRDQTGNIISPHVFIEIAENTGLISTIDQLVISKTLRFLNSLGSRAKDLKFSINLSARTFSDRKLLPLLERSLKANQVPKQNLIFEITETAALQDISAACDAIEVLQDMGCRIAIDDFGVGFSSFYYLRELPVDYVKIDGSFIQQLAKSSDDQLIVRAMSQIVKGFGKKTIAEYVEDETTLNILRKFRVDYAQGFYIGVPSSHDAMTLETA